MIRLSTQVKYNLLSGTLGIVDMFDDAVIRLYSGPIPTSANNPAQGVLLGVITRDGLSPAAGHGLHFEIATTAFVGKLTGETWILTGVANGTAGWGRLSTVNDLPIFSPSTPRLDFEINSADNIGFLMSSALISSGSTRTVSYFNYQIPG